ncbi:hypothetical protein KJ763_00290 [Patescibacteria group bacterium]|nr:hypothetical protein [Patescibacteria group bacterium]
MANGTATIENERSGQLNQARNIIQAAAGSPAAKVNLALSFGKKVSQHWIIIFTAVIFDIFALIPFISIAFNFIFGLILFLYFGSKKKGGSEFMKIALPIGLGSVIDFFASILPVNIVAALIRIALADE